MKGCCCRQWLYLAEGLGAIKEAVYAFQTSTVVSFTGIIQQRTASSIDQGSTSATSLTVALESVLLLA